jgi:opacity protein-like surface antigen
MRTTRLTGTALALLIAGAASAQTAVTATTPAPVVVAPAPAPAADWSQGWSGQATIYGWLPVINGAQEGPDGSPIVDLDTSDVLSALDMAFMGSAQFRKDKFGILLDAVYAKLSTDGTWLQERVSTQTETKLGFYTAALSYRVYDEPKGFVDVYGGARYFDTTIEFKIGTANLGQASFSESLTWTDAIIGVHGGVNLNDRWSLRGFADYGGFDGASDTSWEVYGGANYAFNEHWEGVLGYRYVSIQKEVTERASLDINIQGPLFGITYRF